MSDIINLLPDSLANQIAAGEVVQRPASVVKELLENAIDAKATKIHLIVKESGKVLIQVTDNGSGMTSNDARMCFERHATSKITCTDDLFRIRTMGFRGEAMASIAAVAQVELKTRRHDDELGTLLRIEGSDIKTNEPIAVNVGTTVAVKNLFFNVPARRNFLKSNAIELSHIIDEFIRVALSFSQVHFIFTHNDSELYNLPSGKLAQRIVGLWGNSYKEKLIPLKENTDYLNVYGYLGTPDLSRKKRGEQFFFLNNRFIKHHYLHHAVQESYEALLPAENHAFYVLFLEMDPSKIDINVHPTKTEVKFEDERSIYGILKASVKKGLGQHFLIPNIDFDIDANLISHRSMTAASNQYTSNPTGDFTSNAPKTYSSSMNVSSQNTANKKNWEKLYGIGHNLDAFERDTQPLYEEEVLNSNTEPMFTLPQETLPITFESAMNKPVVDTFSEKPDNSALTFQLHQRYILTQVKSGMMLIDQQAAHERIMYEKYLAQLDQSKGISQQSLFPRTISLSTMDYEILKEIEQEISALGFSIGFFSNNTCAINGIPIDAKAGTEKELLEGLLEQYKRNKSELRIDTKENLARSMAKRASIKHGTHLQQSEISSLIDQLFACKSPTYAPSGNLTFVILGLDKIASLFH